MLPNVRHFLLVKQAFVCLFIILHQIWKSVSVKIQYKTVGIGLIYIDKGLD